MTVGPDKLEEIKSELSALEAVEEAHILYAVESGSRAWGFPSRDSDYDVRFLYVRRPDWYLSVDLEQRRDVVERPIAAEIDLSGWDLRKALQLFAKSNPPLLEWLSSPIVYRDDGVLAPALRQLLGVYYSPIASMHHYRHMAEGNFREYLQGEEVWLKKYLYVLRPLLSVLWIEQRRGPVPMTFSDLFVVLAGRDEVVRDIRELVGRKMAGDELDRGRRIPTLSRFIEEELSRISATSVDRPGEKPGIESLNQLFRDVLETAWRVA